MGQAQKAQALFAEHFDPKVPDSTYLPHVRSSLLLCKALLARATDQPCAAPLHQVIALGAGSHDVLYAHLLLAEATEPADPETRKGAQVHREAAAQLCADLALGPTHPFALRLAALA
jgi:hypothetical protein